VDAELSSLRKIQTDRISAAVPKREGSSGNRRQFEAALGRDAEKKEKEREGAAGERPAAPPAKGTGARAARRGKVIDYEA
jgi:hypothetical protein